MKRRLFFLILSVIALSASAITVTDTIFNRYEHEDYAFGADVSFVPAMESWGTKWLDKNGKQKDILQILKEQGINNIRLRVWTVASGASSKQEVVGMCKRAKAMGMGVMIDFHYSDTFADPGKQTIPSAWTDHSVDALARNVYNHTYDVLSAIKAAGVVPKWVQVGNETKRGMLYPVGQTNQGGSEAFAKFVLNGYNAVKAVDSTMQVIVHLPDGHDNSLYRGIFDGLKKNGAKWDIIGLSAYPRWSHLDGPTMITRVMNNINDLKARYGTPCMVVETGHYPDQAIAGNQYMVGLMDRMIKNGDLGCFYWEPESMGGYDMGAWDQATSRPTVMMDAFLGVQHTEVSWLMRAQLLKPLRNQSVESEQLYIKAYVKHVRDRISKVDFYVDGNVAGTLNESPFEMYVDELEPGVHSAWVKATDTSDYTQASDTVEFFMGESCLLDNGVSSDQSQKGGSVGWKVNVNAPGKYRLLFRYTGENVHGAELWLNSENIKRTFFLAKANAYVTEDIEIGEAGEKEIKLVATGSKGLPNIEWLRVFPLDGQALPSNPDATGVSASMSGGDDEVDVFSLSGVWLKRVPQSQLGISVGDNASAVVASPNCVGGTPYIVRKHRLK